MNTEEMKQDDMCPRCGATVVNPYKQREWVGLTDAEINNCLCFSLGNTARTIEAKLMEKNK